MTSEKCISEEVNPQPADPLEMSTQPATTQPKVIRPCHYCGLDNEVTTNICPNCGQRQMPSTGWTTQALPTVLSSEQLG